MSSKKHRENREFYEKKMGISNVFSKNKNIGKSKEKSKYELMYVTEKPYYQVNLKRGEYKELFSKSRLSILFT